MVENGGRNLVEIRMKQFEYRNASTECDTFNTAIRLKKGPKLIEVDTLSRNI